MNKQEIYDFARHYGEILHDERWVLNGGVNVRSTLFAVSDNGYVTVVMVNGEVVYCDYH